MADNERWNDKAERGNVFLLDVTFWLYRHLGRRFFLVVLSVVIGWYWLFSPSTRQHSKAYLHKIYHFSNQNDITPFFHQKPTVWHTYLHLKAFGVAIVDKMSAWVGQTSEQNLTLFNHEKIREYYGKGVVIVVSHFGNIELLRAIKSEHFQQVNVLVYQKHTEKFNQFLQKLNPKAGVRLISVADMGVQTAVLLQERLEAGEWVIVAGDRVPVSSSRCQVVDFLGEKAHFPEGAWHLAHLLHAPVFAVFCYACRDGFELHIEQMSECFSLPRKDREATLRRHIQHYADLLGKHCVKSPYQWFNFYDFWQTPTSK